MVLRVKPSPTRFPTNSLYAPTTHPCILYQVCATRGVVYAVLGEVIDLTQSAPQEFTIVGTLELSSS